MIKILIAAQQVHHLNRYSGIRIEMGKNCKIFEL